MFKKNGFTLLEVLIAMIVLAIGLLGLAGIQAIGLRNNQSAYHRSQATQLAYDMADRMRVNRAALTNGEYNNGAATANDCEANSCTPAQMAGYDIAQWNAALADQLPGGVGVTCIDSTSEDGTSAAPACDGNGTTYAVKVWWDDNRSGASDQRFVMTLRP
ncbi:MAG: type IV pilus modification protein PilV [Gammaproteobacteria bacterium]|nr:type IV pilus modification protein PilV [Gammaproteobacteria bacterium]